MSVQNFHSFRYYQDLNQLLSLLIICSVNMMKINYFTSAGNQQISLSLILKYDGPYQMQLVITYYIHILKFKAYVIELIGIHS